MHTPVGIVGLGNAGSAMATALSGRLPLLGFDIDPASHIEVIDKIPLFHGTAILYNCPRIEYLIGPRSDQHPCCRADTWHCSQ